MKVREALLIEGGTNSSVLCYGIFLMSELDAAFEELRLQYAKSASKIYRLLDDRWPNGLLLNESTVPKGEDISHVISEAMTRMFAAGRCVAAVCMYDGAFGTYDDIFATDIAPQTYAFAFSSGESVMVLDSTLLVSDEWRLVIEYSRLRLQRG